MALVKCLVTLKLKEVFICSNIVNRGEEIKHYDRVNFDKETNPREVKRLRS